mgnify:CR=1 FL=1
MEDNYMNNKRQISLKSNIRSINQASTLEFITIKEASVYLRVSETTIHHLKNSGMIKFHKIGDSIRFTYEDLIDYCLLLDAPYAICHRSIICIDKTTDDIIPFKENKLYKIINKNGNKITLFNETWKTNERFSKTEFREFFTIEK